MTVSNRVSSMGGPEGEMIVNENPDDVAAVAGRNNIIAINPSKDKHCGRPL